jgi:glycosyltransferase involved in cell wall biosynthesis
MDSSKRRILFLVGSLAIGGTESQLVMLAEQLKKRGWVVEVFVLEKFGPLIDRLDRAGIPVIDGGFKLIPIVKLGGLIALALCQLRLIFYLWRSRPDIVHAFLPLTNFMGAIAGRAAFVPLVLTSKRGLGMHQERHPNYKWLDRISNRLSHCITANSNAVAKDTCARDGYDLAKIIVIPNGLDIDRLRNACELELRNETRGVLGLSETDVAIAMVANLLPYKGHNELVEAFAINAKADLRLHLFLIGEDRGILARLTKQIARFGVADRVHFLGQRNDVPALLSAMDIGVMSSHEEGFSNALLEKLAIGLPVVATSVGGTPEALEGMPDCILVPPRDHSALSKGILNVTKTLHIARKSRSIRQGLVYERFGVGAMVDAYERLYTRIDRR